MDSTAPHRTVTVGEGCGGILQDLIRDAAPGEAANDAAFTAHALLAAMNIDLIDELLASGHTVEDIRHAQAAQAFAVLSGATHPD